ncbi:MAG: hypothetical protein A3G43_11660 [Ignavibacteria bacterium RIFCSPLOWO2_12_FULL_56_21]|nr:MAG: hypothetical protein A3G43_11660 [Ignavibacteria bacterium RIFCSPLOWO2_12_FULL_56_21]
MLPPVHRSTAATLAAVLLLYSCRFEVNERHDVPLARGVPTVVSTPTNVHLLTGTLLVCDKGFVLANDTLKATGTLWNAQRTTSSAGHFIVPLDSIAGVEVASTSWPPGRQIGGGLLGISAAAAAAGATALLLVAMFGSCPTVYAVQDSVETLQAELFSNSIARSFEIEDTDVLRASPPASGPFVLRIRNEALETHYLDRLRLKYADHPAGTVALPDDDGDLLIAGTPMPPDRVVDADSNDVTATLAHRDGSAYSTPLERTEVLLPDGRRDHLDCTFTVPEVCNDLVLLLDGRNSLENTVLLYDIMMRGQGPAVLAWQDRMNSRPWEAWQVYRWYKRFSGIEVLVEHNGNLRPTGRISDTGPIAMKTAGVRIPVSPGERTVTVRLNFIPDGWMIDRVAIAPYVAGAEGYRMASVSHATTNTGRDPEMIARLLENDDGDYLMTYPGDRFDLMFDLPPRGTGERTLFVNGTGFYIEWVRAEWLRVDPAPGFNIRRTSDIRRRLTDLWKARKGTFEKQFYSTRIPSWEPGP